MEKHSELPWHSNGAGIYVAGRLIAATGDDGNRTAADEQIANAAHIVRCVNSHADLVAALERCIADGDLPLGVDSQARAALMKAKGEA